MDINPLLDTRSIQISGFSGFSGMQRADFKSFMSQSAALLEKTRDAIESASLERAIVKALKVKRVDAAVLGQSFTWESSARQFERALSEALNEIVPRLPVTMRFDADLRS